MADIDDTKPNENIDEGLDLFSKKKKKKKAINLLIEAEEQETAAGVDQEMRRLQELSLNQQAQGESNANANVEPSDDLDFLNTKKKPKDKKVTFDEEQTENVEFASTSDLTKKDGGQVQESDLQSGWQGSERDYTYEELLQRVFNIMKERNPDMITGEKKKFIMRPPQVARVGTKKTSFTNFGDICRLLRRQEKHLLNFLLAELGTSGSTDINAQLIIKGRFSQKQIENVLRRYIKEYVTCHTCRSPDTNLVKEERIFFLQCDKCGSKCAVASIKSGFQAQVVKRAVQRAKAT